MLVTPARRIAQNVTQNMSLGLQDNRAFTGIRAGRMFWWKVMKETSIQGPTWTWHMKSPIDQVVFKPSREKYFHRRNAHSLCCLHWSTFLGAKGTSKRVNLLFLPPSLRSYNENEVLSAKTSKISFTKKSRIIWLQNSFSRYAFALYFVHPNCKHFR